MLSVLQADVINFAYCKTYWLTPSMHRLKMLERGGVALRLRTSFSKLAMGLGMMFNFRTAC